MKKILVLTAAFFVFTAFKADAYTSTRLQVHSYDNAPIQVYIDGNAYGNATNLQNIENLAPGYHEMQVTEWFTDENNNTTEQTIFTGGVTLDQGYTLNTLVTADNNLQIINEVAIYEPEYRYQPAVAVNFHPYVVCGVGFHGRYYRAPVVYYHRPVYTACRPAVVIYDHHGGYDRGYHGGGGYHDNGYHGGGGYRGGGEHHEYHGGGDHYSHNGPRR